MPLPLSTAERLTHGQQIRKQLPRSSLANWTPSRRRNPLDLLAESTRGRLPELIVLKNERMAASPFGFFRGAVPIMAHDLAELPSTGIVNQLCGDAHVRNLGAYAGLDGRLVFDINDFDETIPGPFEWDVKRLATSILLAGREAGAKDSASSEAVALFVQRYRETMQLFATMPVIAVAHYQVHRIQRVLALAAVLRKAEHAIPIHTLDCLTTPTSKKKPTSNQPIARIFKTEPPLLRRLTGKQAQSVLDSLPLYSKSLRPERQHFLAQYRPIDVAFKIVGTGSVGLRDYCVYFEGTGPGPRGQSIDPLFLQIKEEAASAYAPYLPAAVPGQHQGHRVVDGARAMQLQSDPFLGYTTIEGRDYLVRQLNDHKAAIEVDDLKGPGLLGYADVCGELLARGHARSGDPATLHGYIGANRRFDQAIQKFAKAYANQTEQDWTLLKRSLKK